MKNSKFNSTMAYLGDSKVPTGRYISSGQNHYTWVNYFT